MKTMIFFACALGAAGCGQGHPTANDSLKQPVSVASGSVADSRVTFTIAGGYAQATPVTMTAAQSVLKLHTSTGERAQLDALELPLGDIKISADAIPPKGLDLRNLVVKAPSVRAQVLYAQDDALELRANVPLTLTASMVLDDGSLYPLGPTHTDPVNIDLQIVRAGGRTTATLQAACLGTCWSVDGVATLSNAAAYLDVDAEVTAAE